MTRALPDNMKIISSQIYLPGVITQKVSCELGFSNNKEGILATVQYLTLALVLFVSGSVSDRFVHDLVLPKIILI